MKVEYVKGETVTNTVYVDKPYAVEIPAKPILPMKPDTIRIPGKLQYIASIVDTAAIIANYIKRNKYNPILFDNNTQGKLQLDLAVQYNKLDSLGYTFTPMEKQTTIIKQKVFTPFVSTSYNTFGYFGAGGGVYYHNLGAGVKYLSDFKSTGYEFGINYKF